MNTIEHIKEKVIEGSIDEVKQLTQEAIEHEHDSQEIIDKAYIAALDVVGERYTTGDVFLPEMLMAGMSVKAGMEILKPLLTKAGAKSKGTVVAGSVEGDTHDIGKNLVIMMLEGNGFKVIDLGTDVPASKYIDSIKEHKADIITMSALISTTRANMPGMIKEIRAAGFDSNKLKIMVGGAPVTQDFANSIGADGYAPDAGLAVKKAKELLEVD